MLDHRDHTAGMHPAGAGLHADDVGVDQPARGLAVAAEGAVGAVPARIDSQVRLWRERHADAHGQVFAPHAVGEAAHQLGVAGGRQPGRVGPLGKTSGAHADALRGLELVARVRTERDRDAEPSAFGHGLQFVRLPRHAGHVGVEPVQECRDVFIEQ